MTKLEKIEQDIAGLSPADLRKLADWIAEYRARQNRQEDEKKGQTERPADRAEIERRLRLLEELTGAGARLYGPRSAEDIDAMIREIRGDD